MRFRYVLATACACTPCWAQNAAGPVLLVATAGRGDEPNVKRTVIEDEGSRIDELRVRGQIQRITVTPKFGSTKSYEIITGDGSRDLGDGANTTRGAAGKRVWNVLSF